MTKTENNVLRLFAGKIKESFSILEAAKTLKQNYSIVYSAFQNLQKNGFLIKDKHKNYSLNYKENFSILAHAESERAEEFLKRQKVISLFVKDALKKTKSSFFSLIIFGSYASNKQKNNSDVDILVIVPDKKQIETTEIFLESVASLFSTKFHISAITEESAFEMIKKRDENNILNETLNNHIICFGAENYYKILSVR